MDSLFVLLLFLTGMVVGFALGFLVGERAGYVAGEDRGYWSGYSKGCDTMHRRLAEEREVPRPRAGRPAVSENEDPRG